MHTQIIKLNKYNILYFSINVILLEFDGCVRVAQAGEASGELSATPTASHVTYNALHTLVACHTLFTRLTLVTRLALVTCHTLVTCPALVTRYTHVTPATHRGQPRAKTSEDIQHR